MSQGLPETDRGATSGHGSSPLILLQNGKILQFALAKMLSGIGAAGFALWSVPLIKQAGYPYSLAGLCLGFASLAGTATISPLTRFCLKPRRAQARLIGLGATSTLSIWLVIFLVQMQVGQVWVVLAATLAGAIVLPLGVLSRTITLKQAGSERSLQAHALENMSWELMLFLAPMAVGLMLVLVSPVLAGVVLSAGALLGALVAAPGWHGQPGETEQVASFGLLQAPALMLVGVLWMASYQAGIVSLAALAQNRGLAQWGGWIIAAAAIGGIAGGLFVHRLRQSRMMYPLLVLGCLTYGFFGLFLWGPFSPLSLLIGLLVGLISAPAYAGVYLWVDRVAPAGERADGYAKLLAAFGIGAALGAFLAGFVLGPMGPAGGMMITAILGLLSALLALVFPRSGQNG